MLRTTSFCTLAALCLASCEAADPPPERRAQPDAAAAPPVPTAQTAPTAETATTAQAAPATLTADGWGPLRIGMTRAEVVSAAGEDANPEAVGGPEPEQCDEFRPSRAPDGMLVMIEQGRLTRISLGARSTVKTEEGLGVGAPADSVKAAYGGRAEVSPHKYAPAPAEYITVWKTERSSPDTRGLVYEVGPDGRVLHVHAGGPSIEYVEGCL